MFTNKFNSIIFAIGLFLCAIGAFVLSFYIEPYDVFNLILSFLYFSAGIYVLSDNRRDYGHINKPLLKSKIIIYILLPILILSDCLLFYGYLFLDHNLSSQWGSIDKDIIGLFALIVLCWIGTIFNLKYYKKDLRG